MDGDKLHHLHRNDGSQNHANIAHCPAWGARFSTSPRKFQSSQLCSKLSRDVLLPRHRKFGGCARCMTSPGGCATLLAASTMWRRAWWANSTIHCENLIAFAQILEVHGAAAMEEPGNRLGRLYEIRSRTFSVIVRSSALGEGSGDEQ